MSVLGPTALMDIALPTGVDASTILNFEMRDGMTPQEVIALAATTIGEVNEELERKYGGLVTYTRSIYAKYRQANGTRRMTPVRSEFNSPDPVRSDSIGHMLALTPYNDATAWSVSYLREAHMEDIRFDLDEIRDSWRDRVDYDVITRMFSNTEIRIGQGYSPGWAIGTGTNLNFIPPDWMGYSFESTHTHFIRTNAAISSSNALTAMKNAAKELAHHGLTGDKVALISEADIEKYEGMTGFVDILPERIQVNTGATDILRVYGRTEGVPGEPIGFLNTKHGLVEIRYHERIPTGYFWMGKSFGVNDSRNPLAIRYNPNVGPNGGGFGMLVMPQVDRSLTPRLDYLKFDAEHGINVNNRLNGVAYQIASGGTNWENPTIS